MKSSANCVFIAYDLMDSVEAEALAGALEARGLDVWLGWRDKGPVQGPSDYAAQLRSASGDCGAFVLLLTGRAVDQNELRELTQRAYAAGRPIFPVLTSPSARVPDFPALLSARPVTDLSGPDPDSSLARLAEDLRATCAGTGAAAAAQPPGSGWQQPEAPSAPPVWPQHPQGPAGAAAPPSWPQQPDAGGWAQPAPTHGGQGWAQPAPQPGFGGIHGEHQLREFVGPNSDFYLRRWSQMDASRSSLSWNFASFFLSVFWLAYRKMIVPALILAVAMISLAMLALLDESLALLPTIFGGMLAIGMGLFGNKLYRNHAQRAIAGPASGYPGGLQSKGGTSVGLAIGLLAAYIAVLVGMTYAFMESGIGIFERSYSSSYSTPVGVSPPVADMNTSMGTTGGNMSGGTTTGTTVYDTWMAGRWGPSGQGCGVWLQFNQGGTFIDNVGATGTWSLNAFSQQLTMTLNGQTRSAPVSRSGETLIISGANGTQQWQRCY